MNNINRLARMLSDFQKKRQQAQQQKKEQYAYTARFNRDQTVEIDGRTYNATIGSDDIALSDGCTVFCIPMENGNMMIIGGGDD